jgi:protein-S-isoprenylcysteine O-methyltransferase Ste14
MDRRGWVITILGIALPAWICYRYPPKHLGTMEIAGLAIAFVGLALTFVARLQLGHAFSVRPHARILVTTGLYSKFRNPIYVFSAIGIAGLALYFDQPRWLLAFLILIPMQVMRARAEARVLEEKFGDDYRRYKASVWL